VRGHNVSHARPELTHQEMQNCVCLNIPDSSDNSVLCASCSYAVLPYLMTIGLLSTIYVAGMHMMTATSTVP